MVRLLRRSNIALLAVGLVLGAAAFTITRYAIDSSGAGAQPGTDPASPPTDEAPGPTGQAPPPTGSETPAPGATPDLRQPFWYVPYLNRDASLPVLEGSLNGIAIGKTLAPADEGYCPNEGQWVTDPTQTGVHESSPVGIVRMLPADMVNFRPPVYLLCVGKPSRAEATIAVTVDRGAPSAAPGLGTGSVEVIRFVGTPHTPMRAAAERWSPATVAGFPAAVLRPVIESVGPSAIVVYDPSTNVTTILQGDGVYLRSLERLLQEITK